MNEIWHDEHPIIHHELNRTYGEIQLMPDRQFRRWTEDVRVFLGKCWEEDGVPPQNGLPLDQIERELQKLSVCRTYGVVPDEITYEHNVIAAAEGYGRCLRRIFPNMDCVGDGNAHGFSVSDFLAIDAADRPLRLWFAHFERNVKRDSWFLYSPQLIMADPGALGAESGLEWVKRHHASADEGTGFWVEATERRWKTGELFLSAADLRALKDLGLLVPEQIVNVLGNAVSRYRVRPYERSKRIFPTYFKLMRKSLVMSASPFSPTIAKFLIQRYTNDE